MTTYQVTIEINESVESEWLHWMKTVHVPDVIATGLVKSFKILKPKSKAQTYLFHYHFASEEDFNVYKRDFAPKLKMDPLEKFPNQFKAERELFDWV